MTIPEKNDDFLTLEEVVHSEEKSAKKLKFPRWSRFMLLFIVIVTCLVFVVRCVQNKNEGATADMSAVAPDNKAEMAEVGLESSQYYQEKITTYGLNKAQEAADKGKTYMAPVAPSARPMMTADIPTPKAGVSNAPVVRSTGPSSPQAQATQTQRRTREQKGDQALIAFLGQAAQRLDQIPKSGTTIHNKPAPRIIAAAAHAEDKDYDVTMPPQLKSGDILYAINRVSLDSDAPGPAMVEVIDDGLNGSPYKGAKILGSFKRMNGHLTLEFTSMTTPSGATYSLNGYAIDPKTDRTAIRSNVDNHTLEKWGSYIAAAFMSGWADAVSRSGTSSYSNMYGGGYSIPHYDIKEQMIIASGKVGDKASGILERQFDIPPTVTLKSGTELGVLILSVGKIDSPVNDAILLQQNAVHQRDGQRTGYPRTYSTPSRQLPGIPQR